MSKAKDLVLASWLDVPTEKQRLDNLAHWRAHSGVPRDRTKTTKATEKRPAITYWDATYAKEQATELWGPYGIKWGLRNIELTPLVAKEVIHGVLIQCEFFCPFAEFEIVNDWPYRPHGDTMKCLFTNTIKKALTMLGWAADLYTGDFEDYVPEDPKRRPVSVLVQDGLRHIGKADSIADLEDAVAWAKDKLKGHKNTSGYYQDIAKAESERRAQLQAEDSTQQQQDRF